MQSTIDKGVEIDCEERLDAITREYQDFAYIVSHDLGAPLRHIREFTKLLVETRTAHELSDEETTYVRFLEQSLERIDQMQKVLLTFSRIQARADEYVDVDLNTIMENVVFDHRSVIEEVQAHIEYANLPVIKAHAQQMHMLFSSIISNALKFKSEHLTPHIIVRCMAHDDGYEIEIHDNGIGIEKGFEDEVFRLFRRLNPEGFEGVGAGLTFARKIIQCHGGSIRVERNDLGSTSVFIILNEK